MNNQAIGNKQNNSMMWLPLIVATLPVLNQYLLIPLTWIELVAIILTCTYALKYGMKISLQRNNYYALFLTYMVMTSLIVSFRINTVGVEQVLLRVVKLTLVSFVFLFYIPRTIPPKETSDVFSKIVVITCIVLVFQLVVYYFTGKMVYPFIRNITLNYNDGINSSEMINNNITSVLRGYYFRPSSVFVEPANFALFTIPAVDTMLFGENINRKRILTAIFISASAILSSSTLALVGVSVSWILFIVVRKDIWKRKGLWMLSLIIVIIPLLIYFLAQNSGVMTTIGIKIRSLQNLDVSSSTSMRLLRGFNYFKNMDLFAQIFGTGYGNLTAYYNQVGMNIAGNVANRTSYMNAWFTILCSFGIVGFFIFVLSFIQIFRSTSRIGKSVLISLAIIMLGSDMFDSASYYLYLNLALMHVSSNNKFLKEGNYALL